MRSQEPVAGDSSEKEARTARFNERRKRRRQRLAKEVERLGHPSKPEVGACVAAHSARLRPEALVYTFRQLLPDPDPRHEPVLESCGRAFFGTELGVPQTARTARIVHREIMRASWTVNAVRTPLERDDLLDFMQEAHTMIFRAVRSPRAGDRVWEEVFVAPLRHRLKNLARDTRVQRGRRGLTGNPRKGESFARMAPMVVLERSHDLLPDSKPFPTDSWNRAVDALQEAFKRLHPKLQQAFQVDEVGRVMSQRDIAERCGVKPDTVKEWRKQVRRMLAQDLMLVESLKALGVKVKTA